LNTTREAIGSLNEKDINGVRIGVGAHDLLEVVDQMTQGGERFVAAAAAVWCGLAIDVVESCVAERARDLLDCCELFPYFDVAGIVVAASKVGD